MTQDFETLIINRGDDTAVVIISLDEYNALTATQHELSSAANEQRLDAAIEKLKAGKGFGRKLKMHEIRFADESWEDYLYWQETDKKS